MAGPLSVTTLTLAQQRPGTPVSRYKGPHAELATFEAQLRAAVAAGDLDGERQAAASLSRALAARGAELDAATKLARRSLVLGDDVSLRTELSTWFAGLGEPALAAATLRPVLSQRTGLALSRVLTRIAVLLARAGDALGAADALRQAAEHADADPLPPELLGAVGAWAPDAVSAESAALAYVEGSKRRERSGEKAAAFEDLLRAFEAAPQCAVAAQALHKALAQRGRAGAADEVLREHARALIDEQAREVDLHRMRLAARFGEHHRAVAAGLDARLDCNFDVEHAVVVATRNDERKDTELDFERLLEAVGLHDLLAVRLDVAADDLQGSARAAARSAAARVFATKLGRPTRAVQLWIDALGSDPSTPDARSGLRAHALQTMDYAPLVEALIRIALGDGDSEAWQSSVEGLLRLGEERLSDPGLAAWAARRLLARDANASVALEALERLAPRVRLQNEALKVARHRLETEPERGEALARVANLLLGRPDEAAEAVQILAELQELFPGQRRWRQQYRLLLERLGRFDELDALLERLMSAAHSPEKEALLVERARLARLRGDPPAALELLKSFLNEGNMHAEISALALVLASRAGDERARAQALVQMAAPLSPPLRATLMSIAAEALLAAGETGQAVALAEQACHADPSRTRPVAALARTLADAEHPDQAALERAIGVVVPRTSVCAAIANAYEAEGSPLLAQAWTQRQLALRPGDLAIAEVLLERVIRAGDAARLSDALAWLLSQPEPLERLVGSIARALRALARLDAERGAALARRALDVLGPRREELREAILDVADAVGERGLAIAVVERWLASGAPGGLRGQGLLAVARRRRVAGDADGAVRALGRALREGVDPREIRAELDQSHKPRGSDGILALLEVRAEVLSATAPQDPSAAAEAWREVGAARWDLAQDRAGAFEAWEHAATLLPESGHSKLAADLLTFAGPDDALRELERLADVQEGGVESARVLSVAASVALEVGRMREALRIGAEALNRDPSRTDVLAIVERSARPEDVETLDRVYHHLAARALGIYGARAAHYRAARQMEQRKQPERAFAHALLAFEAVPTEGVAFVMLTRLVQSLGKTSELVQMLERVAQESAHKAQRSRWLKQAAMFADGSPAGARQRLDVLFRALAVSTDLETLLALGDALTSVLERTPEDREILELRFGRALDSMLGRASGFQGAHLLIVAARIAAGTLGAAREAQTALSSAIRCDPSVTEYEELIPLARELVRERELSQAIVVSVRELAGEEFSGIGWALLALAGELALGLRDEHAAAHLLVLAAERKPEHSDLVRKAERLAHQVGDQRLLEQVLQAVPARERLEGLLEIASRCQRAGDLTQSIEALKRALEIQGLDPESHGEVQDQLADALREAGHNSELEALLQVRLEKDDLHPDLRVALSVELAALIGTAGDPERALNVLAPIARERQDKGLLGDMAALARQAGDRRAQAEALDIMVDHERDPDIRLELLKELAELLQELGDEATALARYKEVLALSPNDAQALSALERDAERRADYETLVDILARRASLAPMVDDVRRIHLHRAVVLEQRLARPEDARNELETLLAATGDNLSVLRVLADLNERLGEPARAAALWLRASGIAKDRGEAADLAFRSAEAQLKAGDVGAARRVLEGVEPWAQTPRWRQLKVDVERHSEDPFALGQAIEALALASDEPPEQRARLLVEAAQIALAAGDSKEATRRVQIAARLSPTDPEAQLMKHSLEYRQRGGGDAEKSRLMVAELRGLEGELSVEQQELRGFLLAEGLDAASDEGMGLQELESLLAEIGPRPLLALGIAERALSGKEYERAQRFFERALAGDLRELRSEAEVALRAAETAEALEQDERALAYAEAAAGDASLRERANALAQRVRQRSAPARAEPELDELDAPTRRSSSPPGGGRGEDGVRSPPRVEVSRGRIERERARTLKSEDSVPIPAELGSGPSTAPESAREEPSSSGPPVSSGSRPRTLADDPVSLPDSSDRAARLLKLEASGLGDQTLNSALEAEPGLDAAAPDSASRRGASDSVPPESPSYARVGDSSPPDSIAAMRTVRVQNAGVGAVSSIPVPFAAPAADEAALLDRLQAGDESAAHELIERLEGKPQRTQDMVSVCRRLAKLKPGDPWTLRRLHLAASQDGNYPYANALAHLIGCFETDPGAPKPPPLRDQPEHPEAVRSMLFRDNRSAGTAALRIVWEGASHVFRRDPSTYGVTGLERIPLGAPTPLARVYSESARAMGMTRTPMFQRRSAGSVTINLALLVPPALILSGEVQRETSALRYHVGSMLAAAWPEHVLLFGAGESPVTSVLKALLIAFGPHRTGRNPQQAANLAEVLWESIPARGQRELRKLCDNPELLTYANVVRAARRVQRRAGLFASGDFGLSLRYLMTHEELGSEPPRSLEELATLCRQHSAVADLVRLATSPEYAEVRWQAGKNRRSG